MTGAPGEKAFIFLSVEFYFLNKCRHTKVFLFVTVFDFPNLVNLLLQMDLCSIVDIFKTCESQRLTDV